MTPDTRDNVILDRVRKLARDLYVLRRLAKPGMGLPHWTDMSKDEKLRQFAEVERLVMEG